MSIGSDISELSKVLSPLESEGTFLIITAYFDKSGTHGGSPATVMGALMGNARQWASFERALKNLRAKYSFDVIHATDFKKRRGEFKEWPASRRSALIRELGHVVRNDLLGAVAFSLDNEKFEKDYVSGEKPRSLRLDSKYGFCFRLCLTNLVNKASRKVTRGRAHSFHVIVESGHKNLGDAERIFREVKDDLNRQGNYFLKTFTAASKSDFAPLMVADVIAHVTFVDSLNEREGRSRERRAPTVGRTPFELLKLRKSLGAVRRELIALHDSSSSR